MKVFTIKKQHLTLKKLAVTIFHLMIMVCASAQTTYYLDSQTGSDKNSGFSPDKAWATLKKLNEITLKPGDKILLKSGTIYKGIFAPKGCSDCCRPIWCGQ